jgi:hypothetical protein
MMIVFEKLMLVGAAVLLASRAGADVRIVSTTGAPGTFASIQVACDQSADGDVVLVQSGTFATFALVNKGITVAAYPGSAVQITGGIRIRNLAQDRTVVLIGLRVLGVQNGAPNTEHGLTATNDHGHVRCEHCQFNGFVLPLTASGNGAAGTVVDSCADISFSNCISTGGICAASLYGTTFAGAGLSVIASQVTLFDSSLVGGRGLFGNLTQWEGGSGGAAYESRDTTLFASNVHFQGGDGGDGQQSGIPCGQGFGGYGGNALLLHSSGDLARLVSSLEIPGVEGDSYRSFCIYVPGMPAAARVSNGGTFVDLPVSARSMAVQVNPLHEGDSIVATLVGQPGESVALIVSATTSAQFNPTWNGNQMFPLLATTRFLVAGTVPAGGTLTYSVPLPDLGPGVDARSFFIQPLFGTSANQRVLGTAVPVLALDSAF